MTKCGQYVCFFDNMFGKEIWKKLGIESKDEQVNISVLVLCFIMEKSMEDVNCTLDEITAFIEEADNEYLKKELTYSQCRSLAYFLVNDVYSHDGRIMQFSVYNLEQNKQQDVTIDFIKNELIYDSSGALRTSYKMTDKGYAFLLEMLEIEENLKIPIQEMIFKMNIEAQNYENALIDVLRVMQQMLKLRQKMDEIIVKIKRDVCCFDFSEYKNVMEESLNTIEETRKKFEAHQRVIEKRITDMENLNLDIAGLTDEEKKKLNCLREIDHYLLRVISEHQEILNKKLDLSSAYSDALENAAIRDIKDKINLRADVYDKMVENPDMLKGLSYFLHPLFCRMPDKLFNINMVLKPQTISVVEEDKADALSFVKVDAEAYLKEQELARKDRQNKYKCCLNEILEIIIKHGDISLCEIKEMLDMDKWAQLNVSVPIMVNVFSMLFISKRICMGSNISPENGKNTPGDISFDECMKEIWEMHPEWDTPFSIDITDRSNTENIIFENIPNENGELSDIRMTNISFHCRKEAKTSDIPA